MKSRGGCCLTMVSTHMTSTDMVGAPSNQLAVISTYIPDGFLCIYHYYRSLAVPQPFPGAEANLDRALKRAFDRWRAERHNEANPEEAAALSPEAQFKKDFVIILAVLTLRARSVVGKGHLC